MIRAALQAGGADLKPGQAKQVKRILQDFLMHTILQTSRLQLRELALSDAPFILGLLNSPGWLRYIGDKKVKTEEQAQQYLQEGPLKSYLQNGFGLYLVVRTKDQCPIGMCGILKRDGLDKPDLGFAFMPDYQGKGYAYEAAAATMQWAAERLKLASVYAITLPENNHSIRLLNKIGMRYIRYIKLPDSETALLLFSS